MMHFIGSLISALTITAAILLCFLSMLYGANTAAEITASHGFDLGVQGLAAFGGFVLVGIFLTLFFSSLFYD